MSLAKTLALNKRGKQMETYSPASQGRPNRGTGNLEVDSKSSGNQAWAHTWVAETVFLPVGCSFWA
jgi:hypothetical protein